MSDEKKQNPQEALAWTTLTAKVAEMDRNLNDMYRRVCDNENAVVATITEINTTLAVLTQVVRETRGESIDQFHMTTARAHRALTAPPEADEVTQLRKEVRDLREALRDAVATVSAKTAIMPANAQPRKPAKTPKPDRPNMPRPDDFAPAELATPPGIRGDDDSNIPVRDTPFRMPSSMSFGEGQ